MIRHKGKPSKDSPPPKKNDDYTHRPTETPIYDKDGNQIGSITDPYGWNWANR